MIRLFFRFIVLPLLLFWLLRALLRSVFEGFRSTFTPPRSAPRQPPQCAPEGNSRRTPFAARMSRPPPASRGQSMERSSISAPGNAAISIARPEGRGRGLTSLSQGACLLRAAADRAVSPRSDVLPAPAGRAFWVIIHPNGQFLSETCNNRGCPASHPVARAATTAG